MALLESDLEGSSVRGIHMASLELEGVKVRVSLKLGRGSVELE